MRNLLTYLRHAGQIALILFVGSAASAQTQPWTIKEFDVVNYRPLNPFLIPRVAGDLTERRYMVMAEAVEEALRGAPLDLEKYGRVTTEIHAKPAMDWYMKYSAETLESYGFAEPNLVRTAELPDGRTVYRIYLVDELIVDGDGAAGVLHPPCWEDEAGLPAILIDSDSIYSGEKLTRRGLQTLAHELFHAVQFNSSLFRDYCTKVPTNWITEGTARAIGWDIARTPMAPEQLSGTPNPEEIHGVRDYSSPLHIPDTSLTSDDYTTNSFWRFLAEYTSHVYFGRPAPSAAPGAVHYGYLRALFDRPADALPQDRTARRRTELGLVDDYLKVAFRGNGVRHLLAHFGATLPFFAS